MMAAALFCMSAIAPVQAADNAEHTRLLQVVVDQLASAPKAGSYLPGSDDPLLAPVLQKYAHLHRNER